MAKGLGLIGAGLKTKEQAFGALTKSAQEDARLVELSAVSDLSE